MTDHQGPSPTPPQEAAFFTHIRGWRLTRGDTRVLGGVASGIAERLGWSLAWTRVGVVAAAILVSGLGLLAYAAAWALLPDRQGRIIAQDFGRGVPNVGALIVIGIIAVLGFIGLGDAWGPVQLWAAPGDWDGGWPGGPIGVVAGVFAALIPLAIIAGVVVLIVVLARRGRSTPPGGAPGTAPGDVARGGSPSTGGAPATGEAPVYATPPAWAAQRQAERAAGGASQQTPPPQHPADPRGTGQHVPTEPSPAQPYPTQPYSTQPYSTQPYAPAYGTAAGGPASSPSAPVAPARPPRPPRVPGPGAPFHLLHLAWFVLSAAAIAVAAWQDRLAVNPVAAWFAVYLTGLGVIIAIVALTGRKLGFLAFLSAVLLIPAGVLIAQAPEIRDGWTADWLPRVHVVHDADGEVVRIEVGDGTITVNGEEGSVRVGDPDAAATADASDPAGDPSEPAVDEDAPQSIDAIAQLEDDYSLLLMPSACSDDASISADDLQRGLIAPGAFAGDRTVEATAPLTTVRIPAGTGIAMETAEDESVRLVWSSRGFGCDVSPGTAVAALTVGDPVLEIDPSPEASIIVIEEVAS